MEYELGWKAVLKVKVAFQMGKSDDCRRGNTVGCCSQARDRNGPCVFERIPGAATKLSSWYHWMGKKSFA